MTYRRTSESTQHNQNISSSWLGSYLSSSIRQGSPHIQPPDRHHNKKENKNLKHTFITIKHHTVRWVYRSPNTIITANKRIDKKIILNPTENKHLRRTSTQPKSSSKYKIPLWVKGLLHKQTKNWQHTQIKS